MCRQNQLYGCTLMAFGLGMIIGIWLEKTAVCAMLGFGILVFGALFLRKK